MDTNQLDEEFGLSKILEITRTSWEWYWFWIRSLVEQKPIKGHLQQSPWVKKQNRRNSDALSAFILINDEANGWVIGEKLKNQFKQEKRYTILEVRLVWQ